MKRLKSSVIGVVLVLIFTTVPSYAQFGSLNVPLTVKETAGVGADGYPVTVVVPLPYGEYQNTDSFRVTDSMGNTVLAQFDVLNRWWAKDKSIRHVKIEFQPTVSAFTAAGTGISTYFLKDDGGGNSADTELEVTETADKITVITGPLKFTVNKNSGFNILDEVWLDNNSNKIFEGAERIIGSSAENGGVFAGRLTGDLQLDSSRDDVLIEIEESGPMRVVIRAEAVTRYNKDTNAHTHGFAVRIYAYTGKPFIKIDYQLQNSTKDVNFAVPLFFEKLNLDFRLNLADNPTVKFGLGNNAVYERSGNQGLYLAQEGHDKFNIYDAPSNAVLSSGSVPDGFIDVRDAARGAAAIIRHFWQMWPNGLEIDDQNKLSLQLFPDWSAQWYKNQLSPTGLHWLQDMQHVYKEALLFFHNSDISNSELIKLARTFNLPPVATAPTGWYQKTKATLDLEGIIPISEKISSTDERCPTYTTNDFVITDSAKYHFNWNNFWIDLPRKSDPGGPGGWPYSVSAFIATENPKDYFHAERFAIGELNIRPQWMAQYKFNDDFNFLQLSPTAWRKPITKDVPYIEGTGQTAKARDTEHAWFYHMEEAYYFTGNPWIKDWYKFIGEYRKSSVSDRANRAVAHTFSNAMQAYCVTGDLSLINKLHEHINQILRPRQIELRHGGRGVDAMSIYGYGYEASFQVGYLTRAIINFLEEVKGFDRQAYTDAFSFISGFMEWNINFGNFGTYIDASRGEIGSSSGSGAIGLADPQAWYYWHTGKQKYADHINLLFKSGINGGAIPNDFRNWKGDFMGRYAQFIKQTERIDATPPPPISDLEAKIIDASNIELSWTAPVEASRYHIVHSDKPISEISTTDINFTNWWAAAAIGPDLAPMPGSIQSIMLPLPETLQFYAIFTFDQADNMSAISNVAKLMPKIPDTESPTIPANLRLNPVSATQIDLKWDISTDNTYVWGYTIYRDDTEVGTSKTNSYSDKYLTIETTYSYTVSAYDPYGNESSPSIPVHAATTNFSIIDNPDAVFVGENDWIVVTHWPNKQYGDNIHMAKAPHDGNKTATWTPYISKTGYYEVFGWWNSVYTYASVAPYTIYYNGGSNTEEVNQKIDGGKWNSFGIYPFVEGTSGKVVLTDAASDGYVIADAVKFEWRGVETSPGCDINADGKVNVLDVQLCVNVVLGIEAREEIVNKAKQVTAPEEECNVLDLQAVVNEILNSV